MIAALLAQAPEPTSVLLNYGLGGIVLALIITRQLSSGREVRELRDDLSKARDELARTNRSVIEEVVPALTRATDVTMRATEVLTRDGRA